MRYKKAKLFWVNENNNEVINSIPYDDKMEYYTFLRNCKTKGYRQVIVTTEIMIQIMRMFVVEKHFTVNKIELAEEDVDLDNEIVSIIKKTQKESIYFCDLLDKMKFIEERSSIDIKKMVIKGEYDGEFATIFYVQSNGIIGINEESFDELAKTISTLVMRCLCG